MQTTDLEAILQPQLPKNPVVITTGPLLGLGDHAVYSTLARRFSLLGYDVFYDGDNKASNPEIFELFWTKNPYFKGPTNLKPNAGYVRQGLFYQIANANQGYDSIRAMEEAHGLPGPFSMAPWFSYEPRPHKLDLGEVVLMDFTSVSSKIARDRIAEAVRMMQGKFRNPNLLQVLHPAYVVVNQERLLESAYMTTSIYEYIDMIAACRAWIGSEAGGQSLASAVRGEHEVYERGIRPDICVTSTRQTFNSRGYTYRTNDYRNTAMDGMDDYHKPLEIETLKYENLCKVRLIEMTHRLQRG